MGDGESMPFRDEHPLSEVKNLKRALHVAGVTLCSWAVKDDAFAIDELGFNLWGNPLGSLVRGDPSFPAGPDHLGLGLLVDERQEGFAVLILDGPISKDIQTMEEMFLHGLQDIYCAESKSPRHWRR